MVAGWFHVTALAILINVFNHGILATGHTFTTKSVSSLGLTSAYRRVSRLSKPLEGLDLMQRREVLGTQQILGNHTAGVQ